MGDGSPGSAVSEYAWAAPAAPLRGLIAWCTGYRQEGVPPASHRGLPSPYLTLIILPAGELARCPPSAWLAEEFRNVQAIPGPPRKDPEA